MTIEHGTQNEFDEPVGHIMALERMGLGPESDWRELHIFCEDPVHLDVLFADLVDCDPELSEGQIWITADESGNIQRRTFEALAHQLKMIATLGFEFMVDGKKKPLFLRLVEPKPGQAVGCLMHLLEEYEKIGEEGETSEEVEVTVDNVLNMVDASLEKTLNPERARVTRMGRYWDLLK